MVVLVGGHPGHHLAGYGVVGLEAGVAVADPGGELLGRRVGEDVDRIAELVAPAPVDSGHPFVLEETWVAVAGGEQVVADSDRMLSLLGGPQPRPFAERRVVGEVAGDLGVVVGEVVLGEQVEDQGGAYRAVQGGLRLVPGDVPVVASLLPGNHLVGVPVVSP